MFDQLMECIYVLPVNRMYICLTSEWNVYVLPVNEIYILYQLMKCLCFTS